MKFLIEIIAIGLLFRFLFRFVIPLIRVTSATHSHIRNMQDQMNNMQQEGNNNNHHPSPAPASKKGDYIDYEEVR